MRKSLCEDFIRIAFALARLHISPCGSLEILKEWRTWTIIREEHGLWYEDFPSLYKSWPTSHTRFFAGFALSVFTLQCSKYPFSGPECLQWIDISGYIYLQPGNCWRLNQGFIGCTQPDFWRLSESSTLLCYISLF